jgi:protein-disulfide isomerase
VLSTAAICSGEQGKFWEMHRALFASRPKTRDEILALGQSLALDSSEFERCLDASAIPSNRIEADIRTAQRLGLKGTPAFALGRVNSAGILEVSTLILGAVPFEVFEQAINQDEAN